MENPGDSDSDCLPLSPALPRWQELQPAYIWQQRSKGSQLPIALCPNLHYFWACNGKILLLQINTTLAYVYLKTGKYYFCLSYSKLFKSWTEFIYPFTFFLFFKWKDTNTNEVFLKSVIWKPWWSNHFWRKCFSNYFCQYAWPWSETLFYSK